MPWHGMTCSRKLTVTVAHVVPQCCSAAQMPYTLCRHIQALISSTDLHLEVELTETSTGLFHRICNKYIMHAV